MPKIRMFQVDAFADRLFSGNPAAVCPLSAWLPIETMQAIAAENNLSETAFFVARPDEPDTYDIRWFTPVAEVDLAGHPTLATAFLIFSELRPTCDRAVFVTARQDRLTAVRANGRIAIDFPARPAIGRPDLRQVLGNGIGCGSLRRAGCPRRAGRAEGRGGSPRRTAQF